MVRKKVQISTAEKKNSIILWLLLTVTLTGLIAAFYATQQTLQIQNYDLFDPGLCEVNTWISCNAAQASSYAMVIGIPVAWWGFLLYIWFGFCFIWTFTHGEGFHPIIIPAFIVSMFSLIVIMYKAVILFFVLKKLCVLCVLMYGVNISIFILLLYLFRRQGLDYRGIFVFNRERGSNGKKDLFQRFFAQVLSLLVIFSLGFILMHFHMNFIDQLDLDIDKEMDRHFQKKAIDVDLSAINFMWGDEAGKIVILVISDFQCPSCRQAAFQLPLLLQEYQHKLRLYFINYPLDRKVNPYIPKTIHPQSGLAARAAICAQNRPEFSEFHDDLFRNQDKLNMPLILKLAEKRPWDIKDFASCLFSQESYSALQEQLKIATAYHILGTPSVIVNGRQLDYWFKPDILRAVLSREMGS